MEQLIKAAEEVSLFCRLHINAKKKLPIRSGEMGMLIYLCKTEESKTPLGVADFFNVSKAMATNMVTSLCKKGYLKKRPAPNDGRSSLLCPTEQAVQLVESAYREYYRDMELLKEKLGLKDFNALISLLEKANQIFLEER